MIRIYASKFNDEPHETYHGGGVTIDAWLQENVKAYRPDADQQFSVAINGNLIDRVDWALTYFRAEDEVDFVVEPKGTELFFGALFLVAIRTLTPKIPKTSSNNQQGKDINEASIKGNKVKLNDPIPDIAGMRKVYPSYIGEPRRFFAGPRDQRVEMTLCIGLGSYQIPTGRILIGDTPLLALGDDAQFTIYGPGQDMSGDPISTWWHSSTEVGTTSTGTAGIELGVTNTVEANATSSVYLFAGYRIDIPSGAGSFPDGWQAGMIARITVPQSYTITANGTSRAVISGDLSSLAPFPGMKIESQGDSNGFYVVNEFNPGSPDMMTLNYPDGSPVIALPAGTANLAIGYSGMRYRLTAATSDYILVDRLTDTGAEDTGWSGFADITSATATISLDNSNLEGNWSGPFMAVPSGENAVEVEWDVFFPGGLITINGKGSPELRTCTVEFQYRDALVGGAWSSVTRSYTMATPDQIAYTIRTPLPYAYQPECRMRRVGAASSSTSTQDKVEWYGLRANIPSKHVYPNATTMTVQVSAGGRISSDSENQISLEATRILPIRRNGVWQPAQPTRDIAPYALYLLKQVGYTDDDLDLSEWDRLDEIWRARGDYYDNVHATASTVQSILEDCLQAGFSEITVHRGLLRPVRDEPEDQRMALYTPQAMTEELDIKFDSPRPDDYDGVDVEYTDRDSWQVATVNCRLPGDLGRRVMKIQANGVLSRNKAYQIGMRQRRALKYRRKTFNWATEMAAFNSNYLDFVEVTGDTPGYAQSAVMHDYDPVSRIVTSGEPFDWDASPNHFLSVRRSDGSLSGPYVVNRIDDYRMQLRDPLDFDPILDLSREPPHLSFGIGWGVQVTEVDPNSLEDVRVEARIYDSRVYLDDESPAPN